VAENEGDKPGQQNSPHDEVTPACGEIEGGFVGELQEPPFDEPKHRALTAHKLALLFASIFAGALGVHYLCFMILALTGRNESAESLGRIFNVWLPALTGIVSSAATYYFTKER
jgi:hypothetical protein